MPRSRDLKSSVRLLTSFYQTILRSIYRRFSRQSKLTSCLVSQGEYLIFPSSLIVSSRVRLYFERIYCARNNKRGARTRCGVLRERDRPEPIVFHGSVLRRLTVDFYSEAVIPSPAF